MARGFGGQDLMVFPSEGLIVTVTMWDILPTSTGKELAPSDFLPLVKAKTCTSATGGHPNTSEKQQVSNQGAQNPEADALYFRANARNEHNRVTASDQNLQEAMAYFADHCAPCHGNDSSGDTLYGKGLYPKPPDLRLAETQKLSDGERFWIIENGIRFTGMPAFGGSHGSQDDWELVLFIRHLPQLTMEERVEMERDDPKGPLEHEKDQEEQEFLGVRQCNKARIGASSLVRVGALSKRPHRPVRFSIWSLAPV